MEFNDSPMIKKYPCGVSIAASHKRRISSVCVHNVEDKYTQ